MVCRVLRNSLALLSLIWAVPTSAAQTDYLRLFESLWSTVNAHFYDPHFRGTDWRAVGDRYRLRAGTVQTDDAFAALAWEMLREIRSSHLEIVRPAAVSGTVGIGARTERIDGAVIVTEVSSLSDAWRQGIRPGDRLVTPAAVRGEMGSSADLEIKRCDGARIRLSVRREAAFWPPERPGFRWRQIRTGAATRIGYLRIDRFDDGAAALADEAMTELGDSDALIVDLRNNSGGNVSALRLASYFGAGAEPGVILMARPYLEALGRPPTVEDITNVPRIDRAYTTAAVFTAVTENRGAAAFWTETVERPYRRSTFVLIGPETGSAAEGFAWFMRDRTPARLVGRETAGALLSAETIEIGDGWSVTLPAHGLWSGDGRDYGDQAVQPHVAVSWTRVHLCGGSDPDMEEVFRLIEASPPS